jgi:autotransporter-associated beta strand protein
MQMSKRRRYWAGLAFAAVPVFSAAYGLAQTYYVSPTGNDNNSGTSPSQAWQSIAKVNATTLNPGSSILFQDGGNWYDTLNATSSGTAIAPITYGSYGTGANPTIWGSNILNSGAFQQVAGTSNINPTYSQSYSQTVNSVLEDHQFLHSAALVDTSAPANAPDQTFISYVESNPDTWYYDSTNNVDQLYVNTGTTISATDGHVYTAAVRNEAIFSNNQSNLVFTNLNVAETASFNGGYGYDVQGGSNVTVENSSATATGKHAYAAIDTTGFVGKNLTSTYSMPDQGNGGASAYVSYSDATRTGDTSAWTNVTYTNPNGPYPAFISHGAPNAIGSITITNLVSQNSGINIQPSSNSEKDTIQGGSITNGGISLDSGSGGLINGVTLSGALSTIALYGNADVLQNSIITGTNQNPQSGHAGAVYAAGTDDIIRFNTFQEASNAFSGSPIIGVDGAATNTMIYGNIFDTQTGAYLFENYSGASSILSDHNLFSGKASILMTLSLAAQPLTQWQQSGEDNDSIVGNPLFVNSAGGNYSLQSGSPALGAFTPTASQAVATDYYGNPRPNVGSNFDLGAIQTPPVPQAVWGISGNGSWDASANWVGGLIPQDPGDTAYFTNSIQNSAVLTLDGNQTVGNLYFDNPTYSYTIAPGNGGSLTFSNGANLSNIMDAAGSHLISAPVILNSSLTINVTNATDAMMISGPMSGTGGLEVTGSGTVLLSGSNTYGGSTFIQSGTLILASTGSLPTSANVLNNGILEVNANLIAGNISGAGILSVGLPSAPAVMSLTPGSGISQQSQLQINSGSTLDLANNAFILAYGSGPSPLSQIRADLFSGYNNGAWNGAGIISSSAKASNNVDALGYADGTTDLGTIVPFGDVLIAYTLVGDTNLDGVVNLTDLLNLLNNYAQTGRDWTQGDFNYDGTVNLTDLLDLLSNYGASAAPAQSNQAIPEPTSAGVLATIAAGCLARRRSR